jgi:hypothetical protein
VDNDVTAFCPSSPHVMLSPKASKRVRLIFGGCATVTVNVHESVRCSESVAVQVTVVEPIANTEPLGGVQLVVTGGLPSATVAAYGL